MSGEASAQEAPAAIVDARPASCAREQCLSLFRRMTAGVAIVTCRGPQGDVGLTASTVTSVSLTPPLLSVCVANQSRTLAAVRTRGSFAVHLLRDDQSARSTAFAGGGMDPFGDLELRELHGAPVFMDCLAWAVCTLEDIVPAGDHAIVLGRIVLVDARSGIPLLWHDSGYRRLAPLELQP